MSHLLSSSLVLKETYYSCFIAKCDSLHRSLGKCAIKIYCLYHLLTKIRFIMKRMSAVLKSTAEFLGKSGSNTHGNSTRLIIFTIRTTVGHSVHKLKICKIKVSPCVNV